MSCTGAHFWPRFPLNWLIVAQSSPTRVARNPISNWGRTHHNTYFSPKLRNAFSHKTKPACPEKLILENWKWVKKSRPSLNLDVPPAPISPNQLPPTSGSVRPSFPIGWARPRSILIGCRWRETFAETGGLARWSVWRLLGRLANLGGYQGSYGVSLPPQPGTWSGPINFN